MNSKYRNQNMKTSIYQDRSWYSADGFFCEFPKKNSEEITVNDEIFDDFTPVDDLNLEKRTKRALKKAGIKTYCELRNYTPEEILSISGMGTYGLRDIEEHVSLRKVTKTYFPSHYGIK